VFTVELYTLVIWSRIENITAIRFAKMDEGEIEVVIGN
jgi:hypothetical protein